MKRKNIPDIDSDFLILPWQGSVRLEKPETIKNKNCISVGKFFTLPFNIYFYDLQNTLISMNAENVLRLGYVSEQEMIGKPLTKLTTDETLQAISRYHQQVLHIQQLYIKEEHWVNCAHQVNVSTLSFKFPWYDWTGKLSGIFGCSVIPAVHDMPTAISTLIQLGLFTKNYNPEIFGKQIKDTHLSKRELDCLKLLARGNTAKMTGEQLGLSPRTVESYLENIKCKLDAYSKAELCTKAMELGLIYEKH